MHFLLLFTEHQMSEFLIHLARIVSYVVRPSVPTFQSTAKRIQSSSKEKKEYCDFKDCRVDH